MNYVRSGWAVFLQADLWFPVFIAAFYGTGRIFAAPLVDRSKPGGTALETVFSIACGFFLCSVWIFVCAYFDLLHPASIGCFLVLGIVFCIWKRRSLPSFRIRIPRTLVPRVLLLGSVVLALLTFIACHAPETGTDSLAYHLYFPRLYVENRGLVHDPYHTRSLWPSMMGMLFSAGLLFEGVALAKLMSWLTAMLAIFAPAVSVYYLSGERARAHTAWLLALAVPAFWQQSFYAYTDHAMMLYAWLFFMALYLWRDQGYSVRPGITAGLFGAALLSIKYWTLAVFGILALVAIFWMVRDRRFRKRVEAQGVFVMAATLVLFCSFWYARSWALRGNPVFPFAAGLFGGNGFSQRLVGFAILSKDPLHLFLLPFNLALRHTIFGGERLGVLFLAGLPLFFLWRRTDVLARTVLAIAGAHLLIWFYAIQHARFLFPLLPFLIVGYSTLLVVWMKDGGPVKKMLFSLVALVAGLQIVLAAYSPLRVFPATFGLISAETYLTRQERSFAIFQELRSSFGKNDLLLSVGEPRLFYAPCPVLLYGPTLKRALSGEGLDFKGWLQKKGVTHVLSVSREEDKPMPEEPGSVVTGLVPEVLGVVETWQGRFFYKLWRLA